MDTTQKYIIKQNALTNANTFWERDETKTPEKVLATAQQFADWVMGSTTSSKAPDLPKVPEEKKVWLNLNTPDYNRMIDYVKQGGTIKQIRNQYMVSNKVAEELQKI